jgi:hypothetical protein
MNAILYMKEHISLSNNSSIGLILIFYNVMTVCDSKKYVFYYYITGYLKVEIK